MVESDKIEHCSIELVPTFHPHLESIVVNSRHRSRAQSPVFYGDFGDFRIALRERLSATDQ